MFLSSFLRNADAFACQDLKFSFYFYVYTDQTFLNKTSPSFFIINLYRKPASGYNSLIKTSINQFNKNIIIEMKRYSEYEW